MKVPVCSSSAWCWLLSLANLPGWQQLCLDLAPAADGHGRAVGSWGTMGWLVKGEAPALGGGPFMSVLPSLGKVIGLIHSWS